MKETLYRGKTDEGIWKYGFLVPKQLMNFKKQFIIIENIYDSEHAVSVQEETIGEYINLSFNNKKIFEGDMFMILGIGLAKVYFDEYLLQFRLMLSDNSAIDFIDLDKGELVLVGNIHDNSNIFNNKNLN